MNMAAARTVQGFRPYCLLNVYRGVSCFTPGNFASVQRSNLKDGEIIPSKAVGKYFTCSPCLTAEVTLANINFCYQQLDICSSLIFQADLGCCWKTCQVL